MGVRCGGHCTARQGKGRRKAGGAQSWPPEGSSGRKGAGGMRLGPLPPAVNSAPQIKPKGSIDWKCSSFLFVLDYGIIITLNKVWLEFLRLKKETEAGVGAGREGGGRSTRLGVGGFQATGSQASCSEDTPPTAEHWFQTPVCPSACCFP